MIARFLTYLSQPVQARLTIFFRYVLLIAVCVHFLPSIIETQLNYAPHAFRVPIIWFDFHRAYSSWPEWIIWIGHIFFCIGLLLMLLDVLVRTGSLFVCLSVHFYLGVNALNINTLAVWPLINMLLIFAIYPTSGRARAIIHKKSATVARALPLLISVQFLGGFFFGGLEKLMAGWLADEPMFAFMHMANSIMVKAWVKDYARFLMSEGFCTFFAFATVLLELALPLATLFDTLRKPAVILYELFFIGIVLILDVPPLFYLLFSAGGVVVLTPSEKTDAV